MKIQYQCWMGWMCSFLALAIPVAGFAQTLGKVGQRGAPVYESGECWHFPNAPLPLREDNHITMRDPYEPSVSQLVGIYVGNVKEEGSGVDATGGMLWYRLKEGEAWQSTELRIRLAIDYAESPMVVEYWLAVLPTDSCQAGDEVSYVLQMDCLNRDTTYLGTPNQLRSARYATLSAAQNAAFRFVINPSNAVPHRQAALYEEWRPPETAVYIPHPVDVPVERRPRNVQTDGGRTRLPQNPQSIDNAPPNVSGPARREPSKSNQPIQQSATDIYCAFLKALDQLNWNELKKHCTQDYAAYIDLQRSIWGSMYGGNRRGELSGALQDWLERPVTETTFCDAVFEVIKLERAASGAQMYVRTQNPKLLYELNGELCCVDYFAPLGNLFEFREKPVLSLVANQWKVDLPLNTRAYLENEKQQEGSGHLTMEAFLKKAQKELTQ